MDNIVVADKHTSSVTQNAWGNLSLKDPSLVQMPVAPDKVATVSRQGQDLVVNLKSGEKITVGNFFAVDQDGLQSDIVFVGEDGTLWHANYNADAFAGFTFEEVASLDELMAGIGVAGSGTPTWAIAGLSLLGVGGAAAASNNGGGGSSGGDSDPVPGDTTAPASPIDLLVSPNGLRLTGSGEAGSTVNIRDAAGNLIGTGTVGADGRFDVQLSTPQINSENLEVTLTDGAGNTSAPGTVTAPDATAPVAPSELAINEQGSVLTGRAEPGSTVQVRAADGSVLGSAIAAADGSFSIDLQPAQTDGQPLQVSATDAAGNTSPAANISAPDVETPPVDTTAPDAPTNLVIGAAGNQLSGRGEPGTTVQVRDADGNLLATATVGADGSFQVTLAPAVIDGSALQVTLTDAAGNVSQATSVASRDLTAPAQPTDLQLADGVTLTGRGEPGTTVQVRNAAGTLIGSGVVADDGSFSLTLSPAQANGEALDIRLVDGAQNSSTPLQFDAPDITPPAALSDIVIGAGRQVLAGRGEAGATVEVRDADGNLIGTATVGANGTFVIELDNPVLPGENLSLTQTDPSGNVSPVLEYEVPLTTAPASPSDLLISADGSSISGTAPAGSEVEIRDANGNVIGSVVVGDDGTFVVALNPPQANGELLDVVAVDADGNSSLPVQLTAPDITAPAIPTELAVSADGSVLTGRAEPGSTVRVVGADGAELGSVLVGPTGIFSIAFAPPLIDGEALQVSATDAQGNTSGFAAVNAPDIDNPVDTTAPLQPTDVLVSGDGRTVSGRGEAGTTVKVLDADGNVLASATVLPDGTFSVQLPNEVIDGSALQVTLTDAAGNVSTPATVASPDLLAPEQPTELVLTDGTSLTGSAEANARVEVRDAAGNVIGSGTVGADGSFTLTLDPAQANGEALDIRVIDAAGNVSVPLAYTAPDITAPTAITDVTVGAGGLTIAGRGEAGATVEVRDADGNVIGSGTVGANGTFLIDLDSAVTPGETIALVQTDAAGNVSPELSFDVPNTPVPASPSDLLISADGSSISGTAPAGSEVEVRDANGNVIGSVVVGDDGTFVVALNPPQANGELLDVVAIDADGNSSLPVQLTAPDITAPAIPTELAVNADGSVLTGRAEPGSTVRVVGADGAELGNVLVGPTGIFSIALDPPLIDGEALQVSATDAQGNTSGVGTVNAPDIDNPIDTTAPLAPTDLLFSSDGRTVSGRGEAGTSVKLLDADGNLLAEGTVLPDGTFSVQLPSGVTDGSALQVTLTDAAGNVSQPGSVTSPDLQAPGQPADLTLTDGTSLTGSAEANARVEVRDAAGNVIGSGTVGADGSFTLTLDPAQANGEALDIRVIDAAGNVSVPLAYTAPDITPPTIISNVTVGAGGLVIAGRGEAGASVEVRDADGNVIGSGTVGANGTFLIDLDAAVAPGDSIVLVQTDAAGNVSPELSFDVPNTPVPASPSDLVVAADGSSVSGTAPAGSEVEVRDANGNVIGSVVVGDDGTFVVALNPPQANGELLDVVAIDADGNSSLPVQLTAPDITAPAIPTELAVTADGSVLTGRAEPGSTVRVVGADGAELGSVLVGPTGIFSIALDPPLIDGEALQVSATDAQGNTSGAGTVNAPDIDNPIDTTAPLAPTDLLFSSDGRTVSGRGEAGTSVKVLDADGNVLAEGTVLPDGTFSVQLPSGVTDGSALQVTLTDAAGNVSQPGSVTSPDLQAPAQPADLTLTDGTSLTGSAEANARVEVRDAAGNVIGSGTVGADGSFTLTLDPAQANGEALDIRVIDAAGNVSVPLAYTAPDITPPTVITNVTVGAGGLVIAGRGEAGATVEVRDADGNVIGSGTVGANGTFLIDLDAAVAPGDAIVLVQTDAAGNVSPELSFDVPNTPVPASPSDLVVAADGSSISGTAPAGSEVEVRDANGNVIGSVVVGDDGTFVVALNPPQANGELLDVVAIDADGNSSLPVQLTAPDITAPAIPTELAVSADGSVLTGRAEPGSTVRVVGADGAELGSVLVGPTGIFSIALDPPLIDGEALQVSATDAQGNTSGAGTVNAPDIDNPIDTTAPLAPTDLLFSSDGRTVSGRGEAGTSVKVLDADGNVLAEGTVLPDGTFSVQLPSGVTDGSALQVTLTDAAGNVSQPGSVTSPDLQAPGQPADLTLTDGTSLTGSAEANAQIEVRDAAGNVIGSGTVGPDGSFTLTLDPAQANGEALDIRVIDAAGNVSVPLAYTAPDITPPTVITDVTVGAGGLVLAGRGEAGASVEVRDADGNVIGSGTVGANGTFLIDLDAAVAPGDAIVLVQTDAAGNASPELSFDVPNTPVPESPSDLVVAPNGASISGTAPIGSEVEVRDANGNVIGSVVVGADGTFVVALTPPQANGEQLDVVAIDADGNSSLPVQLTAPDITAPAIPTELAVSADGSVLTGRAEPGSTVRVVGADGAELGNVLVGPTGIFSIALDPPLIDGEALQVSATDAQGNTSGVGTVNAPDIDNPIDTTAPVAPTNLLITSDGRTVSGRGEAGTTVKVLDADGNVLAEGTVLPDGTFSVQLPSGVTDGSALQVILTDAAGNVSQPGSVTSPDLQAPAQPADLTLTDGTSLTGSAEANARVEVRDAAGNVIGSGTVGPDGSFTLSLDPAQANGEALDIRVIDAAGNVSVPLAYTAPDITPPTVITDVTVGAGGLVLAGRGEAGASVEVRDADGNVIGSGTVGANGTFLIDLDAAVAPGDAIVLVQTDAAGNASPELSFDVPNTPVPESPSDLVVAPNGASISGTAPIGSEVEVRDADGNVIGSVVVGADGTFVVALTPPQANGEQLDVVAIDADGNSSLPTLITAPDFTAPEVPTDLVVSADGSTLSGRAEPGSTVRVIGVGGTELGSVLVGPTGAFSVAFAPPLVNGEALQVSATDVQGNISGFGTVNAPDIDSPIDTTAPLAPSNLLISSDGRTLSGRGEAGTTVKVLNADGTVLVSATVLADGSFSLQLPTAITDGSARQVTLTDAAGNVSPSASVTSPDLQAPEQPSDLTLTDGNSLTGSAEVGARVEVRDAAGELIGSGTVGEDGTFTLILDPPQANGEALAVSVIDATGNASAPLAFDAPDITPPGIISNVTVGTGGLAIAGRGEAGAQVQIRDADGNLIGEGTVGANGSFLINLDAAVAPGEPIVLVQTDAAGNASPELSYNVPNTPVPASPSDLSVAPDGSSISGTAPAGSEVQVRDADGNVIGSVAVGDDGTFVLPLSPAQANGELLDVVTVDADGNSSLPTAITAPDITAPDIPTALAVSADGTQVTGRAEPGSTVRVVGANGSELGSAQAGANGVFTITLDPAQVGGEALQVSASDAKGNTSGFASVNAPDIDNPIDTTAPQPASNLLFSGDGRTITGRGEAGATVKVLNADGTVLASSVVLADGSFSVQLPASVTDGSTRQVTLTDAAGNVSQPATATSPDLEAPAQPTGLSLTDGDSLSGSAEANAQVEVRDAAGTVIGSGTVGPDGTFTLTLDPPQANGEVLDIRVIDAKGNTSVPLAFDAPDITPPTVISDVTVGAGGLTLAGRGEAGAQVQVRDADGNLIGEGTVADNGTFLIDLEAAVAPGDAIVLVQTDAAGNISPELSFDVPNTPVPATPSELVPAADGTSISGTAPAGTRVEVRDVDDNVVGTVVVGAEGTFVVVLTPPQANGEQLDVVAIDGDGNSSLPAQVTAPDITAPAIPTELAVSADGTQLTGRAEPGSTVRVVDADGTDLGSAEAGTNGVFTLTLDPPQVDGETLLVTASDAQGNESDTATVTAPFIDTPIDNTPPEQASNVLISPDGRTISGRGEVGAIVKVVDDQGQELVSGTVQPDGSFSVQLPTAVTDGSDLQITLTDAAGNVSPPATVTSPDLTAPEQPTGLTLIDGNSLSGSAEPAARVEVRDASGDLIGSAEVAPDGTFSLILEPAQANGEVLDIRVIDADGNTSIPLAYDAPDITPPAPATDITVGSGGLAVSGRGEAGASVQVRNVDGDVIGNGVVGPNGTFLVDLDPAVAPGDTIVVFQSDAAGNLSVGQSFNVPNTPVPDSPSELVPAADGSSIGGTAPAGTEVQVRDADGNVIGSVVVGDDGTFVVPLTPAQANGEVLDVVAIDPDGNSSLPTQVTAPDITAPDPATNLQLSADGVTLVGNGEPGANVEVTDADGTVIASGVVGPNGVFTLTLSPAQDDGQALEVRLSDAEGNTSAATAITAPDLDGPLLPSGFAIDASGTLLTGVGQAGSTVTVRSAAGDLLGTAIVAADGRFSVTLGQPQRDGESLAISADDPRGNTAGPVNFNVPDTLALPVTDEAISPDGSLVSGQGEPGATITVRGPAGEFLGSGVVGPLGDFEVTLIPAQTNGQALTIDQRDLAGNLSTAVAVTAPDTETPDAPTGLGLSADGSVLSGSGEPGATVTVTGTNGVELGSAVVQSDGSFQVTLDPPQLNGQTLSATQADAAGNVSEASDPLNAPDLQAPAPAQGVVRDDSGSVISGQGEPGTTVEVRDPNGGLIGSDVVGPDGTFSVTLNPVPNNGETLSVVLVDDAGLISGSVPVTAIDTTPPALPTGLQVNNDGTLVWGTGEVGTTVEVRNADGDVLGTVTVPAGGTFAVPLDPAQRDGETLDVVLIDASGNETVPVATTAPDLTAPAQPTDVTVRVDGTVTGNAPGATEVIIRDGNGDVLVSAPVSPDGSFTVTLPTDQDNGQSLTLEAIDAATNSSPLVPITAPDTTPPAAATDITVSPGGDTVGGTAEPGSTVIVRDGNDELGSVVAGPDGTFVIPLDPPLSNGDTVQVVVRDPAGNETSVDISGPDGTEVAAPSDLAISADGFLLTGQGTVGALITVTSGGTTLGTAIVGTDGVFRVFFTNAQLDAQTLQVNARLGAGGKPSIPVTIVADDSTAPDAPTQLQVDRSGSTLTGRGEVGATVTVVNAAGTQVGTGTVGSNGLFSITFDTPQANGQTLTVTQADAAGNVSLANTVPTVDLQAPIAATEVTLNTAATVVSGSGEAGAQVTVRDANGNVLATGNVNASGQFQITLPSAQTTGAPLQVTLSDSAGNSSPPTSVATPDRTPPAAVSDTLLSADGRQLAGSGEVGATVQVRNAAGTLLGSATVGADGRFTVVFDTPQASGQPIGVTQVDAAGNTSPAISVTTSDLTPPAPLTNLVLNNNGLTLTGLGEAGASVTVRGPDGTIIGTGQVAANGSFSLTLDTAQLNAQRLSVTQADAGNNTSTAVNVTAPDLTPPAAPSNLALAPSGVQLTGSAEAGSTVLVRDSLGNVIGTTVAASNGTFQVDLSSVQANGETLRVTATDAAGNVSPAGSFTAPDTTPPAAVGNLAVSADGNSLAGVGEAGATVTVSAADGTPLGTTTVAADGSFTVPLNPAATPGESLSVVQTDTSDNPSPAQTITAPGNLAPDVPSNLELADDGLSVTGSGTIGSTVSVYGPGGVLLGSGVVGNDGTFNIALGSVQANGEVLQVSAVGTDNSASLPATLQAPDTTAPQPLSDLQLSTDGLTLTGRGEVGARVTIIGQGGVDLGEGIVAADGTFSIDLAVAQINGETITGSQFDAAGNESNSINLTAPDRVAPDAPENLAFAGSGTLLNGTGEAGAKVNVLAADGTSLGNGTVRADGSFQVTLTPPQTNGQTVNVVLTDAAGNQSAASSLGAADTTAPDPVTTLAVSSDGALLTGRGEAGATVTVTGPNGLSESIQVDPNGYFAITLDPPLGNAQLLSLTQADAAGNVSAPATVLSPDFTPPALLTEVARNDDGSVVTGRGEVGATVTVTNAAGTELGKTTVLADGSFRVELTPAQINGEALSVQQADPPGNISLPVVINAPDLTPPEAPTELRLNAAGDQLSGVGEPGTTVTVYLGLGQTKTTVVGDDGTFQVALDAPQLNGQQLLVTLTDIAGNVSPFGTYTAPDITPPQAVVAAINDSGTQLRGTGEAGAKLTVINDKGEQVGTGSIDADGTFVVNLSPSQVNGEVLSIIAQDATGNPSAPTFVDASDLTPPEQPIDLILSNAGATLSGTAEAGSTITVLSPDNTQIGVILVPDNGSFSVTLNPAQSNGQTLTVIATDEAGNASVPGSVTALDTTAPDQATNITINTDRSVLSGRGEPGAEVSVSRGGNVLGTGRVAANGTFEITLDPPATGLLPVLTIKQTDEAGNSSDTGYTVPLIAAPAAPTNVELAGDGLTVTGSAAAGSQIRVYDSANQLIGSGVTSINGGFNFQLDTPQLNGETISVVVFIALGNESPPVIIDAADITPPAAPLVANLSTNGLVLTGTGEPGASVTVRDANGDVLGTGTVNAGGAFSVNLNTPQLNGQVLAVTQADAAGNVSDDTSYTARDVQAPGAPTELAVDGTGTVLTGKGEPGATISIVGQAGTAIVGSDGNFTFTLSPAQLDGQSLTVRQADAAGNLSGAGSVTAPDSTAPAAPIATINTTGAVVSGSGVAGNTITVRNSSGTVLGSAVVAATGAYAITLNPPQTDFQALSVTQSDPTGNTSAGTALTAPDFTPPAAATALVINADGSVLTGRGEPGATVTVRGPTGTVLTTAPVEADGTFRVVLNPAQDNGQSLSVTVTDPRNNTSASASITAPDVDANTPVVASDNLATATVELAAVSSSKTYADSFTTVLAGFQKTYTWTVAAGTTADPTLTLNTDSVVALLDNTTFTLQVKDASGAWVTLASGTSQGLLDLILLPLGQGLQVDIGTLQAGDYRLTVGSGGIGVLTTVTTTLDITSTSLTEFTGTGTAATGNVITDPGIDGTTDVRGPDSAAVLQVLKNGVYVDAGAGTTVQGLYGTLVIRADGSYTYTPSGSPSSVGKVDVFSYQLATDGGLKDTANLYVRIDSPQATEIWSDTNYSAPATVVDAVNDVDNTGISLINRETTSTANLATLNLPVLGSRSITSAANMVALDTTADLQVVLNSNNLLGLLNGTKIELLKANASGTFVVVDTVNGGSLISLLGGGAAHTFQDQGPGSYQIKVTAGGIGLLSSINTTINTTTTYNKEFMVSGYTPVSGNLINDTSGTGSDTLGSTLTVLSVLVAANTYSIPGYNGVSVTGTYGTLLVHEDGSYTYTLKSGLTSAVIGQHDTFTYQLTHPNGTSDTAQLTVNLTEAGTVTAFSSLLADTSGDDGAAQMASLAAVSSSDLIQGSEGNDHLDGSQGGAISLQGGAGDDTLVIVDQQFTNVDGGSGTDTLLWAGGDASIDLGNLVGRVHDIEIIDLNDTSAVTLSLNLADVIAVTETGNDTLLIKGGSEDSVQLTDNWTVNGNQTADGIDYTQYTAQEDPSHHLWVQNGIHVV